MDIDFWKIKKTLQFKIKRKMYPPRVRMTVDAPNIEPRIKLPIRFEGCLDNSQLDMEILFPLSMIVSHIYLKIMHDIVHYIMQGQLMLWNVALGAV